MDDQIYNTQHHNKNNYQSHDAYDKQKCTQTVFINYNYKKEKDIYS